MACACICSFLSCFFLCGGEAHILGCTVALLSLVAQFSQPQDFGHSVVCWRCTYRDCAPLYWPPPLRAVNQTAIPSLIVAVHSWYSRVVDMVSFISHDLPLYLDMACFISHCLPLPSFILSPVLGVFSLPCGVRAVT